MTEMLRPTGRRIEEVQACVICTDPHPSIGRRQDGWANRDLNVGAIIALSPNLEPFTSALGVDDATVRAVLNSWGPGKFDAELILDGKAELRDAAHLMGKITGEVEGILKKELADEKIEIMQHGPAAERGVLFSSLVNMCSRHNGRTGMGLVMASKNLKAVVVRGRQKVLVSDPKTLTGINRIGPKEIPNNPDMDGLAKYGTASVVSSQNLYGTLPTANYNEGQFTEMDSITGEKMAETILKDRETCFACVVKCKRVVEVKEGAYKADPAYGGPEYETIGMMGSSCGISDLAAIAHANQICNEYGVDTIACGGTIAFAMECYEKGVFTKTDTGGLDLTWGNADAMIHLTEMIGKREGLGALLAKGTRDAAKIVGKGSERFVISNKGVDWPGHSCRPWPGTAVGYATGPRGGSHHDIRPTLEKSGVVDRTVLEGKGAMASEVNHWLILADSAVVCHLGEPIWGPAKINDNLIDALNAVTGWNLDYQQARTIGERQWNMIRCFAAREGFTRNDDTLPIRFMEEPVPEGPMKGSRISKETLEGLKDQYYEYRGWDKKTGNPSRPKLAELGLEFAAKDVC